MTETTTGEKSKILDCMREFEPRVPATYDISTPKNRLAFEWFNPAIPASKKQLCQAASEGPLELQITSIKNFTIFNSIIASTHQMNEVKLLKLKFWTSNGRVFASRLRRMKIRRIMLVSHGGGHVQTSAAPVALASTSWALWKLLVPSLRRTQKLCVLLVTWCGPLLRFVMASLYVCVRKSCGKIFDSDPFEILNHSCSALNLNYFWTLCCVSKILKFLLPIWSVPRRPRGRV